jgi:hypothetical protein
VLSRLAEDAGVSLVDLESVAMPRYLSGGSSWVFLARDAQRIRSLERAAKRRHRVLGLPAKQAVRHAAPALLARAPLWTDDYSDLYRALAPNGSRPVSRPFPLQ